MVTWALVYHLRQAEGRERHIARRYIQEVPDDATMSDIHFALDAAGKTPAEFGIEWANHSVIKLEAEQRLEERGEPETSTWDELVQAGNADRRVTLRMSPSLHRRVTAAAETAGRSINTWCVEAIEDLLISRSSMTQATKEASVSRAKGGRNARTILSLIATRASENPTTESLIGWIGDEINTESADRMRASVRILRRAGFVVMHGFDVPADAENPHRIYRITTEGEKHLKELDLSS